METVLNVANRFMTVIGLVTAFGVFLHDGRVDKATTTALTQGSLMSHAETTALLRYRSFVETDAHTHPDHNAARSSLLNSFTYRSPSIPPRDYEKRHLMKELRARGHFAFDNANLPIIT